MSPQESRRDEMLDAAMEWVLAHGLGGLSLRPLAQDLGTSDRMLVYYFGTKDALVDAVLTHANQRLALRVAGDPEPDATPSAAIAAMWQRLSHPEAAPYLRLYFEVHGLALQQPERYRPFLVHVHQGWLDLTAHLLEPAAPSSASGVRRATVAVALVEGLLLDLLVTDDRERVEAAATAGFALL